MHELAIDIETYSSNDLTKCGVYKYTEAKDFEILLFAYGWRDQPVQIVDLASGEELSDGILQELLDPDILKTAHNAAFERTCISRHFGILLPPDQWECTMARASMLGLPLSLDAASKALRLEQQKDAAGKSLIRFFSIPCKPSKANGQRIRNQPAHDLVKWEAFKKYCVQDVEVELAIRRKIEFFTPPATEKLLWQLDQRINDTGILINPSFVRNAICIDVACRERMTAEAIRLTGLENPNSVSQLKAWIKEEVELLEFDKLTKDTIPGLLTGFDAPVVERVLQLRLEMSKTSVKKYTAMQLAHGKDNRIRGLLQYYGANRTGRWAGRLVQVQNLPQNHLADLDLARQQVLANDAEMLEMLFGNIPDTLSQLIRTAFVAAPGHRFLVADFSAIEARVIAWLACEKWRLDVFRGHGKIYEASGAHMFRVPIESVTKGSSLRQKAKIAELALGYQGGPNALVKMGALKMGLVEEELPRLVAMWRNANKNIVQYWEDVGNAALDCVINGTPSNVGAVKFYIEKNVLFIQLPSGRKLAYLHPTAIPNKFNSHSVVYEGMDQTTKQWKRIETYGGKLTENIVQAVARDILADAMLRLDAAGYKIVIHVHDEIVAEMPEGEGSLEEMNRIMSEPIPWAKGLPLQAESYETPYYKKD